MKLNIGSHSVKLDGFLNVDIEPFDGVDVVCDITQVPWKFKFINEGENVSPMPFSGENFVDEIVMVEVLEHISFHDTDKVLKEIYRVLKPGGKIHIQVPDCGSMMEMFAEDAKGGNFEKMISDQMPHKPRSLEEALKIREETGAYVHPTRFLMAFCGAQKYGVPDIHKNIFWKEKLQDNLEEAGFERIDFKEDPLEWKIKVNAYK
jgi:predicted SAM-dependent methyltransferase